MDFLEFLRSVSPVTIFYALILLILGFIITVRTSSELTRNKNKIGEIYYFPGDEIAIEEVQNNLKKC